MTHDIRQAQPARPDPETRPDPATQPDTATQPDVETPVTGARAEAPVAAPSAEAIPPALAEPPGPPEHAPIWPEGAVPEYRQRWRDVQLTFVDDPRAATEAAQALVTEAADRLTATLATRQHELDSWSETGSADTDQLREAVRRYRDTLDWLLKT